MEVHTGAGPWESITLQGTPLSYHENASFKDPALLFDGAKAADEETLRAAGLSIGRPVQALHRRKHRVLRGAAGLAFILLGKA
jgi:hypothetical protein